MVWCSSMIVHSSLLTRIRYSLAGQDTRLSPERPGFESRWRKLQNGTEGVQRVPFVKSDKPFRIDVSYVSGLFAELRFYSCRWATLAICKFCTACVCLEQFFRSVCSGNGTIYQLHK